MSSSPARRRTWITPLVIVVVMALTATLTWWIAGHVRSPQQVAADASAPPAGPITARAARGALDDSITARAHFGSAQHTDLVIPAGTGTRVVTAEPLAIGTGVGVGDELLEISGRPLFAVDGAFPYYRDLAYGDTGTDVRQWQTTLRGVGFSIPEAETGTVGPRTAEATARFYHNRHTQPPSTAAAPAVAATASSSAPPSPSASAPAPAATTPSTAAPTGPRPGDLVLPQAEVLVLPAGAQRIEKIPAMGATLGSDATLTLSGTELAGVVTVPALDSVSLRAGMSVSVTPDGGAPVAGSLGDVPAATQNTPAQEGATAQPTVDIPLRLSVPVPPDWDGRDLLVTIVKQHIADDAILVPTAALDLTGGAGVFVRDDDGGFTRTAVTVLGQAQGMSALQVDESAGIVDSAVIRLG